MLKACLDKEPESPKVSFLFSFYRCVAKLKSNCFDTKLQVPSVDAKHFLTSDGQGLLPKHVISTLNQKTFVSVTRYDSRVFPSGWCTVHLLTNFQGYGNLE